MRSSGYKGVFVARIELMSESGWHFIGLFRIVRRFDSFAG